MFKRLLLGGGVGAALAGAFLLGSVTLGAVAAQAPTPSTSQATVNGTNQNDQQPAYSGSIAVPQDQNSQSEQNENAALAQQAKISADQAKAAALAQFPGATVTKVELDNENGSLVYSVQLTDTSGKSQDVKVDAGNGKVLATEVDGPEGAESHSSTEGAGAED